MNPSHREPSRPLLLSICAVALLLALTLPPLSSTRIQAWPFAAAAAAFWILPILVASLRAGLGLPNSRLGGMLDLAFPLLAAVGLTATLASPLRATLAPHLLPFLGSLALPYALLPLFHERREAVLSLAVLLPLIAVSAILWQLSPVDLASPHVRNDQPFGHANTTGSIFALAACWFGCLAWRTDRRSSRLAFVGVALLCLVHVVFSGSRGSMIAIATALAAGAGWGLLRRGRILAFALACILIIAATLGANPRLREAFLSGGWSRADQGSNVERVAMIRGGLALFAERPLLGWGLGSVPHAFPGVRATLPGTPDNYLNLHNTPAQLAATLGLAGLAAAGVLLLALGARCRDSVHAPPALMLVCAGVIIIFDHPFATPIFAVLVALPIAAIAAARPPRPGPRPHRAWLVLPALIIAGLVATVGRDLLARAAWSDALDAFSAEDPAAYETSLRRARGLAPADPFYADQLASHLSTGHPFPGLTAPDPAAALPILRATAARNPRHEFAHYNLGWLLLGAPSGDAGEAEKRFAAAARLAPARRGVYLGLALARIQDGRIDLGVAALAAETLAEPAFAWSPIWRDPALAPLRSTSLEFAAKFLSAKNQAPLLAGRLHAPGEPSEAFSAYRRVRTGHGVLYGHPDGPPPGDVNILVRPRLPRAVETFIQADRVAPEQLLECAGLAP